MLRGRSRTFDSILPHTRDCPWGSVQIVAACVIVDVHERPSGVPRYLASLEIEVEIAPLAVGDYVVAPGVLVERKTVRSAHTAIVQGTFWAQIGRLRRDSARHYLLLEGANVDHGPLPPAAIRGVCLAVTEQNIHVIRSTSPYDSALWLARLAA